MQFSYNLVSGTREALTYDSLLESGQEERYLKVSCIQENIYLGVFALTNLLTVVTVTLGYRKAYLISVVQGLLCSAVAWRLSETRIGREKKKEKLTLADMGRELKNYSVESIRFLVENSLVCRRMLVCGAVSAGCYIVYMMMQEHLVECGLSAKWVGIPRWFFRFSVWQGQLWEKNGKGKFEKTAVFWRFADLSFISASGSSVLIVSVLAAGLAHGLEES